MSAALPLQDGLDDHVRLLRRADYDLSEPEPDVAVVDLRDHGSAHPDSAYLVIESSSSSRRRDLGFTAGLYARHGVPEHWVVDLDRRAVVVHLDPTRDDGYQRVVAHGGEAVLEPSRIDGVAVAVAEILP